MFRVLDLLLHNFKGFENERFTFDRPCTIFGGPNGYGKTSIFDALELLFTGTIQRMQVYRPGHDDRTNLKEEYKPLVYDTSIDEIAIEANIQLAQDRVFRIKRSAEQGRMKNPVDFTAFSSLQFFNQVTDSFEDIETNEDLSKVFTPLSKQYAFLNYLTQEEANQFLKCKEHERKQQINNLFQTKVFDEPLEKLTSTRNEVNGLAQDIKEEITLLKQDIESLQSAPVQENGKRSDAIYARLFEIEFDWDKENPQLSFEEYNGVLSEGGVLDQLTYYCKNVNVFRWIEQNEYFSTVQKADNLIQLATWLRWRNQEDLLSQFDIYIGAFRKQWEELNLSSILSFSIDLPPHLPDTLLNLESVQQLNEQIVSIQNAARSAGDLQRSFADLVGTRNLTEKTLQEVEGTVHITQCPLCGSEYGNEDALLKGINEFGKHLQHSLDHITKGVATSVEQLKDQIGEQIIKPIDAYYESLNINCELLTLYHSLDKGDLRAQYSYLVNHLSLSEQITGVENEIEAYISESVESWRKANPMEIPDGLDVPLLRRVNTSYGRYFLPEQANEASIEKKRQYLTGLWNARSSQLLAEKTAKNDKLQVRYNKLYNRSRLIKQTIDKINNQKKVYLRKMVNQIETLFYIYTGRIMQDNYYGRGCFLKYNQNNSNVLFTSGSPDNEVDALYKMSSGQLVSISVAFMLTVNKLYADQPFIAIDDPVQTIDDLNLWGLMETLRHDFKDSTILLSTHERDFGFLLTDKFNKVGLETEYVDMSQHH